MKKFLKYLAIILTISTFTVSAAQAEWWTKGADSGLYTNGGNGLANSDIHVAHCYIGTGTGTPCGSSATGTVTSFTFTDGSGFDGTVTNSTTTPTLSLKTQLTTGSVPFIGAAGALSQDNTKFFYDSAAHRLGIANGSPQQTLSLGTNGVQRGTLSMDGFTSGHLVLNPNNNGTDWAFTFPVDDGTSGQILSTDGSGNTSWVSSGSTPATLTNHHIFVGDAGNVPQDTGSGVFEANIIQDPVGQDSINLDTRSLIAPSSDPVAFWNDNNFTITDNGSPVTGNLYITDDAGLYNVTGKGNIISVDGPGNAINANGSHSIISGEATAVDQSFTVGNDGFAFGKIESDHGQITVNETGGFAFGYIAAAGNTTSQIKSNGQASQTFGYIDGGDSNAITSNAQSDLTFGYVNGDDSLIQSSSLGSLTFGYAEDAGVILSNGAGSMAFGHANGNDSSVYTSSDEAFAFGSAEDRGQIGAEGLASFAFGQASGSDGNGDQANIRAEQNGALAFGSVSDGSYVQANGEASLAFGQANGNSANSAGSYIKTAQIGAQSFGQANNGAFIYANGVGSQAIGKADGDDGGTILSNVSAFGIASYARGNTSGGGQVNSTGVGSQAFGVADGTDGGFNASGINSSAQASLVFGTATSGGYVDSFGANSLSFGSASGAGGTGALSHIRTQGGNSMAFGTATDGGIILSTGGGTQASGQVGEGTIEARGSGSHAFGYIGDNIASTILSGGQGSLAGGYVEDEGKITTNDEGGFAFGHSSNPGSEINANAVGSFAGGTTEDGGVIKALGEGSFAFGRSTQDTGPSQILATNVGSIAFGTAFNGNKIQSDGAGSFVVGTDELGDMVASGNASALFGSGNSDDGQNYTFMFGTEMTAVGAGFYVGYGGTVQLKIDSGSVRLPDLATGSNQMLSLNAGGQITTDPLPQGTFATPAATNVANISSSGPTENQYTRVGDIVTFSGAIAVTTTLAVASEVDINLPAYASNFTAVTDANGVGSADTAIATNIVLTADATNNRIKINFVGLAVSGSGTIYYSGSYRVK